MMDRRVAWVAVCALVISVKAASSASLDLVLAAAAAEREAMAVRAEMKIARNGATRRYVVERVQPDRLRLVRNDGQVTDEVVIIGKTMFVRGPRGFQRSPVTTSPLTLVPSAADLLATGLSNVVEQVPAGGARIFVGDIQWSNGGERNKGQLLMAVDTVTGLPQRLDFDGSCNGQPCQFRQTFVYGAGIEIVTPP